MSCVEMEVTETPVIGVTLVSFCVHVANNLNSGEHDTGCVGTPFTWCVIFCRLGVNLCPDSAVCTTCKKDKRSNRDRGILLIVA